MTMEHEFRGRVVVVTGGAANLGAEIARQFAAAGAEVVVADIGELPSDHPGHLIHTDVTNAEDVDRLVAQTVERFGRLDVFVNNAAIWFRRSALEITPEEWDRVLAVNLRGPFLCSRAVAPVMEGLGGGVILNIGSQAGVSYTRGQGAHYQAAKAGIGSLTRVLAFEFGPKNIRVNCVAPGVLRGDSTEPEPPGVTALRGQTPLGRFAAFTDVAAACLFFASDAARTITGQTLLVNGGSIAYL